RYFVFLSVFISSVVFGYVGSKSGEATLTFVGTVEFSAPYSVDAAAIEKKIDDQILHLFGPLKAAIYPAVPKGDEKITPVFEGLPSAGFRPYQIDENTFRVDYQFEGEIALASGPRT